MFALLAANDQLSLHTATGMHRAALRILDGSVILGACISLAAIAYEAFLESRDTPQDAMQACWISIQPELESPEGAQLNEELSNASRADRRFRQPSVWSVHLVVDERASDGGTFREYYRCYFRHPRRENSWILIRPPRAIEASSPDSLRFPPPRN